MYVLRNFLKKLKRSVKYIILVWKTETWDYSYALEFWKVSLLEIKESMLNGYILNPERHTKRIDEIVALLDRIAKHEEAHQSHYDAYDKKYGEFTWDFGPSDERGLSAMITTNSKRETPQARKEHSEIHKHIQYLYKQDIDRLALLMKKYLRNFWD